ncbi:MAG: metallophosphoesterase family protein [Devosia sp.]
MRIAHLSDLHFGHHDPRLAAGLAGDIAGQQVGLVVVSGDFTQIGSRREFEQARTFLEELEAPVFAVPGNHDVPAVNMARRFLDPFGHYRRYIAPELEPFLALDGVAIAGLCTARRIRPGLDWAQGKIGRRQLVRLETRFAGAHPMRCGSWSRITRSSCPKRACSARSVAWTRPTGLLRPLPDWA